MLKRTSRILMEGITPGLETGKFCEVIQSLEGVKDLHHIHVWDLDEHHRAFEAHVVLNLDRLSETATIRNGIRQMLETDYGIVHATLELEEPNQPGTNTEHYPKH